MTSPLANAEEGSAVLNGTACTRLLRPGELVFEGTEVFVETVFSFLSVALLFLTTTDFSK